MGGAEKKKGWARELVQWELSKLRSAKKKAAEGRGKKKTERGRGAFSHPFLGNGSLGNGEKCVRMT